MPWGVKTLKILGDGLVQESDLTSFEFPLGHYEDYILLDEKHRKIIKIVTFPTFLFEEKFYGKENNFYTMHFIKFEHGIPEFIKEQDYRRIADKYLEQTGKKLIQEI